MWRLKIAEGGGKWLTTTNDHVGRQHWEFDPEGGTPEERAQVEIMRQEFKDNRFRIKQSADLLMRMQLRKENPGGEIPTAVKLKETEKITEEATTATLQRAISFYSSIQAHDGHWPAESSGALFFHPMMVMALYLTGGVDNALSPAHQVEIKRYIYNHQNEDGGWGFHIIGPSTIFGSLLNYITLRLLGEGPEGGEDRAVARGRKWILDHGGAVGIASWGKFWLSVLGIYEWDGCNPMPPEFWLLPKSSPIHPGKMLCYFRLVYMPMSYLYGKRFVGPITGLIRSIREEIYTEPYHKINWNKARNTCAKEDLYYPHPLMQDMLWGFLHHLAEPVLQRWPFSKLREKAMELAMKHVHYEDSNTRYLCIGNAEKVLCMLACWVEDPSSEACKRHLARLPDYFWVAEDGLKMQTFGCQTWDAAFAIQAILSANLSQEFAQTLKRAHSFIKASQVRDNPPGDYQAMYRHTSKGAWTFAIQDHGWQVSDCTAEGLKCALLLSKMPEELVGKGLETERIYDAVNVILSLQSDNGGFTAWEPNLAPRWLEKFNPTEFFEDTLIEREHVECTSSAVQALAMFIKMHKGHRSKEIEISIARGIQYIDDVQERDGSWSGYWGICFTYGTWFAVEALAACGKTYDNSPSLRKACKFLLSKQLEDGGWGESYLSNKDKVYTNLDGGRSNLVQTSWALLSLIKAGQGGIDPEPIHRGIRLLINSQMEDGDFPQQGDMTGAFMKNCTLNYSSYRNIFPIWALGDYHHVLEA
ncbi:lupeol synthase [Salvia divinorum]|uniref:Terpene cyclase/mutase family member n=1 Tax=Salvia divinorum TaxID=28513 RepID=A0ABD1GUS2_SALDI